MRSAPRPYPAGVPVPQSNHPREDPVMRIHSLALALVLLPATVVAAEPIDRLRELVAEGRMEAAYDLASEHVDERAGQPRFDLYYGIAAVEIGNLEEGVFALERVLIARPGLDRARLEYARALYLQGNDLRARRQFEIVRSHDPPPAVVDRLERYLAAINRRADQYETRVTGDVGLRLGYDGNVNRATDADAVDTAFGTLALGGNSSEVDAAFAGVDGDVEVSHPLAPGLNLLAGVSADAEGNNEESDFNTTRAGARVGLRWITGPHRVSSFVRGQQLRVGGDAYQRASSIDARYRFRIDDQLGAHATASWTRLRYDELEVLDSSLRLLGGGLSKSWSGSWSPSARFTALVGDESAEEDSQRAQALAQRDIWEVRARASVTPAPQWSLRGSLRVRDSEYDENTFPFLREREEEYYNVDVALDWRPSVNWRLGPYITYTDNDANIGIYDYDRTVVGFETRYTFY